MPQGVSVQNPLNPHPQQSRIVLRQFQFIRNFIGSKSEITSVSVQRIDLVLMDSMNQSYDTNGWGVWIDVNFYLLDKDGRLLVRTGFKPAVRNPNRRWYQLWKPKLVEAAKTSDNLWIQFPESVQKAVARLRNPAELQFILYVKDESGPTTAVLYKLPKGFTITEWLEREKQAEAATIQVEIDLIDLV